MSVTGTTYEATLYAPLFYASSEGRTVETQPILSATALGHALGYEYLDLEKRYVDRGVDATTPDYERLAGLPLFVSDMTPVSVQTSERTLRGTAYSTERRITTTDEDLGRQIGSGKGVPDRAGRSMSGWHRVRKYTGLAPGSTYRFTVWTPADVDLPDTLRFRMGIRRTGEFTARRTERSSRVILNKYLLTEAYDDPFDHAALVTAADRFQRGNDPRLHHFVGVPRSFVEDDHLATLATLVET